MVIAPYPWLEGAAAQLSALTGTLPNSILLHGAAGCGGFELARAFAASLLCESPLMDGAPCGECPGCKLVAAGTHPDLKIIVSEYLAELYDLPYSAAENETTDKKKRSRELRIHQFRALSDFVVTSSHRGGRRIVLVYPAEMIRAVAAASLLKTLEEPTNGLHFILVADDIDGVLPTIRSRSRLLRLNRPSVAESLAWLKTQRVRDAEEKLALSGNSPIAVAENRAGETLPAKAVSAMLNNLFTARSLSVTDILAMYSSDMTPPAVAAFLSRFSYDLLRVKAGLAPYYFIKLRDEMIDVVELTSEEKLFAWNEKVLAMARAAEHPLAPQQVFESVMIAYIELF